MKVVILGKPGSGNCIIRDLLEAAGVDYPYVSHGWPGEPDLAPTHVILTKRDEKIRALSRKLRKGAGYDAEEERNEAAVWFFGWARLHRAKIMLVHYRDIVERPEETRMALLDFVGAGEDTPWPRPITDEDKKHIQAMETQ